jgi:hypothetical protein
VGRLLPFKKEWEEKEGEGVAVTTLGCRRYFWHPNSFVNPYFLITDFSN